MRSTADESAADAHGAFPYRLDAVVRADAYQTTASDDVEARVRRAAGFRKAQAERECDHKHELSLRSARLDRAAGSVRCAIGRRSHDRLCRVRLRRSAAIARDHARLSRRSRTPHKGQHYPADPPTVEEIIAVMRQTADDRHGVRVRALIAVLWRGGLRIQEALALGERDLDPRRGSLLVRRGKGGRRREIGMDAWGWEQLAPWLVARVELPVGPLFCIIDGPTRGQSWSSAGVRVELRRLAAQAGVRRRFAPHQLRHAHAVELAREGVPLNVIQRQLGHANLGTTSIYLQGIDTEEIIATVHARRAPMMSATAGLHL